MGCTGRARGRGRFGRGGGGAGGLGIEALLGTRAGLGMEAMSGTRAGVGMKAMSVDSVRVHWRRGRRSSGHGEIRIGSVRPRESQGKPRGARKGGKIRLGWMSGGMLVGYCWQTRLICV